MDRCRLMFVAILAEGSNLPQFPENLRPVGFRVLDIHSAYFLIFQAMAANANFYDLLLSSHLVYQIFSASLLPKRLQK